MKTYYCIGLMSGTSLDGVDLCYISINSSSYDFKIIEAKTFMYETEWKEKLKNSIYLSAENLLKLHVEYGLYLGVIINKFCKNYSIKEIDFIASHGHTVFHNPAFQYTLQIGDGSAIMQVTQQKVICDFRSQDVVLGGQGAPLVPIGDKLLFNQYHACLNLGGFSNISFSNSDKRIAFDICPVNIILNSLAQKLGKEYDENGELAKKGTIIPNLLEKLNQLNYYSSLPPKSLGIEWCIQNIYPLVNQYNETINVLTTFTHHIAQQIAGTINNNQLQSVLITGGGVRNSWLIELIQNQTHTVITIPDEKLVDFKEALIFALLGMLKLENKVNILSSVTGAIKDHSSGIIYTP